MWQKGKNHTLAFATFCNAKRKCSNRYSITFLSAIFVAFSQKSHLNRILYVFRLFPIVWMFPNFHCFHNEWGLSLRTSNGS